MQIYIFHSPSNKYNSYIWKYRPILEVSVASTCVSLWEKYEVELLQKDVLTNVLSYDI